jgi:TonB family protein
VVAGPGAANQGEGFGADESIRELLRRTGGGPTMALAGTGLTGLEFQSFSAQGDENPRNELAGRGAVRRPGAPDPSATGALTADEQSALDLALERLAGFSPEVALEASSSWVLIRNPRDVERFMGMHSINRVEPASTGTEGAVAVALWIDARGSVEWAEIIQSSGREDLDQLALELFNDVVRFRPARLAGVLSPMSAIFSVNFSWF